MDNIRKFNRKVTPRPHDTHSDKTPAVSQKKDESSNQFYSLLDNKETSMQFCPDESGSSSNKNSFLSVYYRKKNLTIANALLQSKNKSNESIKKIAKGLRCCSTLAVIEADKDLNAHLFSTGKKCKRTLCANCNRITANKYKSRFLKAYSSPQYRALFANKYFYFLTFTLLHDQNTRNYVYFNELKGYITEIRRSTVWKKYFPFKKKNPQSGWVQSYELTITDNGFNIHSHAFMCCPRIKVPLKQIRAELSAKWLKITGDSTGLRFNLLKVSQEDIKEMKKGKMAAGLLKAVSETFKYTVKVGTLNRFSGHKVDLLTDWIIETKGRNMVTSNGFFRPMQLFTCKSHLDEKGPPKEVNPKHQYFAGRTSQISFNHSTTTDYPKHQRQAILKDIFLKELSPEFINISSVINEFIIYMSLDVTDLEVLMELENWVCAATMERDRKGFVNSLIPSHDELKNSLKEHLSKQLVLFDEEESDNTPTVDLISNW